MEEKLTAVILDDDEVFTELLENKIKYIAQQHHLDFAIISFQNISELEINVITCDILFLDIELSELNSIVWVKEWKEKGRFENIIFVSAYHEYVFQSFESQPIAFVRKTNLDEDLNRALELYKRKCNDLAKFVSIPEGKKIQFFKVADILYLRGSGHYIEFYMTDGKIRVLRGRMDAVEGILEQHGFVRIKISCLLNVKYITMMDKKQVLLKNGEKFRISSKYQDQSLEKLKKFFMDSGE